MQGHVSADTAIREFTLDVIQRAELLTSRGIPSVIVTIAAPPVAYQALPERLFALPKSSTTEQIQLH